MDVRWIHGSASSKHNTDPEIQVHAYEPDTFILRQNMAVHYEAPFMFLLMGTERALLIDTGATPEPEFFPLRSIIDGLLGTRKPELELLVLHTHSHADHVAGDGQFQGRPNTRVIGTTREEVTSFFGFDDWPNGLAQLDLGRRVIDVIPSPGHDEAAVSYYDRATGLLLTGDTVYPGRLYVRDWEAFAATIERLVRFAEEHPVAHVLGCHIEMTREPGRDYKIRTTYQPDEPALEMTVDQLRSVRDAVERVDGRPGIHTFGDFLIYNGIPDGYFG